MTAASYTSDLSAGLITNAESGSWGEFTQWAQGGGPSAEADYFIQGSGAQSQLVTKSGLCSAYFSSAADLPTIPADGAFTVWVNVVCTNLLDTDANGGLRLALGGSSSGNYKGWNLGGKTSYVYGGWINLACNPAINGGTPDYTYGTPNPPYHYIGAGINMTAGASRGSYFNVDAIYIGRCEARIVGGTSPDTAATFAGFAAQNDATANRWGLLQAVGGGYLWKGLLYLGYGGAVRFTDANTQILVDRCPKVTAAFNRIEIHNASSEVNWTGISFLTLTGNGSTIPNTASRGQLEVVDDCNVNISGCSFTGMSTFVFKAASDVLTSVFRNCGVITANSANFAGTQFIGYEGSADSSYLDWNTNVDPQNKLAGCSFTKGTAATHAISFTDTNLTSIHIPSSCVFTGYNANDAQSDSTVYIAKANGSVTIYYDGDISYKSAGATVTVSPSQATLTIDANVDLNGAEIRIYDLDSTLPDLGTELAGTESCPGATYDYTGGAGNTVWLQVLKDGYVEFGQSVVTPASDQTLNIILQQDLNV